MHAGRTWKDWEARTIAFLQQLLLEAQENPGASGESTPLPWWSSSFTLFKSLYLSHTSSDGPVLGACRAFFLSFFHQQTSSWRLRDSFSSILVFLLFSAFALIPSVWTFRLTLRPVPASQFHWPVIYSTLSAMERSRNNHGNGDHLSSGRLWHRNTCGAALRQADGELNSPSGACAALLQPCALKLGRFRRFCF